MEMRKGSLKGWMRPFKVDMKRSFFRFDAESHGKAALIDAPLDQKMEPILFGGRLRESDIKECRLVRIKEGRLFNRLNLIGTQLVWDDTAVKLADTLKVFHNIKRVNAQFYDKSGSVLECQPEYQFWHQDDPLDLIDREKSDLWMVRGNIIQVKKAVLKGALIPDLDLFADRNVGWVVSGKFVDVFSDAKITGCSFSELQVA